MFVISQYILNTSGICKDIQQVSTYSIAVGLVVYSSIYLYILFYNNKYLSVFNKFIMYIVIVDILLSVFYYFSIQNKTDAYLIEPNEENEEYEPDSDSEANFGSEVNSVSELSEVYQESNVDEESNVDDDVDEESRLYIEELIKSEKEQEEKSKQENLQIEDIVNNVLSKKKVRKTKVQPKLQVVEEEE